MVRAVTLQLTYPAELATAAAIDPASAAALAANPDNQTALVTAVGDIAAKFKIDQSAATIRLIAFNEHVPAADQAFLTAKGTAITAAGAALTAANTAIPKPSLAYLQANAATVQKAQKMLPGSGRTGSGWLSSASCCSS